MLMNGIKKSYWEMLDRIEFVRPVVTVPVNRPAANAASVGNTETQARLLRRERRSGLAGQRGSIGWKVSAW